MPLTDFTLVDVLQKWAQEKGSKTAFTCLSDDDSGARAGDIFINFSELDRLVRGIAAELQDRGAEGERVLLLYPPGIDFVAAFLGCLYAGAIAVPSYPPAPSRRDRSSGNRLLGIIHDASPALVLTTSLLRARVESLFDGSGFAGVPVFVTDTAAEDASSGWVRPDFLANQTALLQYTSGATGPPKGVLISHTNLLDNLGLIHCALDITEEDTGVNWLPPYHDMGLIGGLLQPVYEGSKVTLVSPVAFLQRPFRWLEAISRTRATVSGGPNFAYDLCVKRITAEQKDLLDLSCWRVALNGAEPIVPSTLHAFETAFASCGFSAGTWSPCYGMAETTLFVCGGPRKNRPLSRRFDRAALEDNRAVLLNDTETAGSDLAICGSPPSGVRILIVDSATCKEAADTTVGEVWVGGLSVGQGYWNNAELTGHAFQAYLSDTGEGPFLRTGDLGFLFDGDLFVTGRLQDQIILGGRCVAPQHLESVAESSHGSLRAGASSAFLTHPVDSGYVIVVAELEREALNSVDPESVIAAVRENVRRKCSVELHSVLLLKTATIPKTTSGKPQRHACRERYLAGSLDCVAEWTHAVSV